MTTSTPILNFPMNPSNCQVIVWEWLQNTGIWQPYDSDIVAFIEQSYGTTNSINLGSVNPTMSIYKLDFIAMCQVRLDRTIGGMRNVRRQVYPMTSLDSNQICWQWAGDYHGHWHAYCFEVSSLIESVYSSKQSHFIDLSQSQFKLPYFIDLNNLQQVRIETGTARTIRRERLKVPYPICSSNNNHLPHSSSVISSIPTSIGLGSNSYLHLAAQNTTVNSFNSLPGASASSKHYLTCSSDSDSDGTTSNMHSLSKKSSKKKIKSSSATPQPLNSLLSTTSVSGSVPQMTSFSNSFLCSNQTSSPFLNSFSFPSSSTSGSMNSSYQSSTGPNRQQLDLMQSSNSSLGNYNLQPSSSSSASASSGFISPSNGVFYPSMMNITGHGSKISPVVSNITNVLTSPVLPGAFASHLSTNNYPPATNSWTNPNSHKSSFATKGHINLPKIKKSKGKSKTGLPLTHLKPVLKLSENEDCCICCEKLNSDSAYGKSNHPDGEVVSLSLCNHMFHRQCLTAMYDNGSKDGSLQCPSCKKIHGLKQGTCPAGDMEFWTISESLSGYPGSSTICLRYNIRSGTQGPEHPNPGQRFSAHGFPRVGYLPDTDKGRKILQLFTIAWKRRIMFTIGTSLTNGYNNTVTWNEIHHKTEFGANVSGHGYPDPNYLDNVLLELSIHGVTEEDLNNP